MSLSITDVASLSRAPAAVPEQAARGKSRFVLNRRNFIRLAAGAGMGVGLTVLEWLPPMRLEVARASHCPFSVHEGCAGIPYGGCQGCCGPCGSDIDSHYCGCGANWHRHDTESVSASEYWDYAIRTASCEDRNAWKWTVQGCCNGRHDRRWRCSDGKKRFCRNGVCGAWQNTVCPEQIDTGVAC
jgi:hypothetical protein